jgi:general secretion pathway protein B
MSFILDALRKSEHERERKTLPGLAEAPIVRQERTKVPIAMIALGVLLAINLLVLLFVLLRDDARDAVTAPGASSAGPPAAASPAPASASTSAPPTTAPLPASPEVRPLQAEAGVVDEGVPPYVDTPPVPRDPTLAGDARVQRVPVATDGSAVTATVPPEVLRSAQEAARRGTPPAMPAPSGGGAAGVPSINDLAPQATAGLPALAINLHVYAGDPRQDFVVLNGRRYQQGAQLQEGPTLERITSDGVVLNHRGLRFLLPRQ